MRISTCRSESDLSLLAAGDDLTLGPADEGGSAETFYGRETAVADVDVSVVIPVYRSEASLRLLVARLLPVLEGTGLKHEIIFVEDGGADASWRILEDLRAEHPDHIVAVQLMRNYGQHNALMCGFRLAL